MVRRWGIRLNEPAKLAAEFSPGRKPGDNEPLNVEAREAGDRGLSSVARFAGFNSFGT